MSLSERQAKNQSHNFLLPGQNHAIFSESTHIAVVSALPNKIWANRPLFFSFTPLNRATRALCTKDGITHGWPCSEVKMKKKREDLPKSYLATPKQRQCEHFQKKLRDFDQGVESYDFDFKAASRLMPYIFVEEKPQKIPQKLLYLRNKKFLRADNFQK